MATYRIDESTLIAIADAVRNKTGSTEALNLAQITEDITALEVGGGLKMATGTFTAAEDLSCSAAIHFEGAPLTGYVDIQHNLGVIPKFGFCVRSTHTDNSNHKEIKSALFLYESDVSYLVTAASSTVSWIGYAASITESIPIPTGNDYAIACFCRATENSITVIPGASLLNGFFLAGIEYKWVMCG